jgi:hypothetical protein
MRAADLQLRAIVRVEEVLAVDMDVCDVVVRLTGYADHESCSCGKVSQAAHDERVTGTSDWRTPSLSFLGVERRFQDEETRRLSKLL